MANGCLILGMVVPNLWKIMGQEFWGTIASMKLPEAEVNGMYVSPIFHNWC
jgi:hypothetical protein